jgi:hypothetical protein
VCRIRAFLLVALLIAPRAAWPQGAPLGPEFRVNTFTSGDQASPRIASDASGNFVVVWYGQARDGSSYGVFGQRFNSSGTPLGIEFRVNSYTTRGQFGPSIASDASGNVVVVWTSHDQDGSGDGVFGQRYASSGVSLGPEFRINTYTTGSQNRAEVASDTLGNFVVAWESYNQAGLWDVFGQRFAGAGTPLGQEFRVNTYTTGNQFGPSVAADPSGTLVVVWVSYAQDGSSYGVFGQRYTSSGTPLGAEFRVNSYTAGGQGGARATADASGNFLVVWGGSQDASGGGVFGQRFASSGAPMGPEFQVNTYTTSLQSSPFVAVDSFGDFVVTWNSLGQDGSAHGVFAQRYASSGLTLGPEFRVNTYTTSAQATSAVAADPSGNFVVVWLSQGQDGSLAGVYGQRYGQIVPIELMGLSLE